MKANNKLPAIAGNGETLIFLSTKSVVTTVKGKVKRKNIFKANAQLGKIYDINLMIKGSRYQPIGRSNKLKPEGIPMKELVWYQPVSIIPLMSVPVAIASPV
jgi:hypothetical protein